MAPDQEPRSFEDGRAGEPREPRAGDGADPRKLAPKDRRAARMSLEEIDRALRDEHVSQR